MNKQNFSYKINLIVNQQMLIQNVGYTDFVNIIVDKYLQNETYETFYKKMLKDYIQSNLFKLYKYDRYGFDNKKIKYDIKTHILTYEIIHLICDYLNINIIIFDNKDINIFHCCERMFLFKNMIFLYFDKRTKLYHYLQFKHTYIDQFVFNIYKYYLNLSIPEGLKQFKWINEMKRKKSYYTAMKIAKIKDLGELYNINIYKKKKHEIIEVLIAQHTEKLVNMFKK